MSTAYEKAYTEVLEILRFLPRNEYDQIPKEEIDFYESYRDKSYQYNFDPSKGLHEQPISREANAVLVTIFRDFFASEVQQEKLGQMLATNEQRQQAQLRGRHKGNKAEEDAPVIPYKISLFTRIFTKLRAIFCQN